MKKIFVSFVVALMFLLIPMVSMSAVDKVIEKALIVEWDQLESDLPDIAGWSLYMTATPGAGYEKAVDIPFVNGTVIDGALTFSSDAVLSIVGASGATVNKYFVLVSKNAIGDVSAYSNEVAVAFEIPYGAPAQPLRFRVKIVTATP